MSDGPETKTCEFSTTWPPDPCGKQAIKAYVVGTSYFYVTCNDPDHDATLYAQALEMLHEVASGGVPDVIIFDAALDSWILPGTGN